MEPVTEGSNNFLRGFKNPSFHFDTLSLLQNTCAKPYVYVVRKKLLNYFLNGLRARLEDIPYYLSYLEGVFVNTPKKISFLL
jgi:hypothetical protein